MKYYAFRKPFPWLFLALFTLTTRIEARTAAGTTASPSFIVILCDDLGYGDLGCYGSKVNETPHVDRLAKSGLRWTDFHSNGPMCTPTRAALLTGCYQQRFGADFDGALNPGTDRAGGLPLDVVTIAEVLSQRGYSTGMFGKWHLGYKPPLMPINQGFDEFRGLVSGDGDHHTHISRDGLPDWWRGNEIAMDVGYATDLLTDYSIDFIERNRKRPFFLYLAHLAIHFPWQGPEDPSHRVEGKDYALDKWGIVPDHANVAPHVKAMIESVDASLGRLLAALERLELAPNTLVVFMSDNGGYLEYDGEFQNISNNGPLRGQKGEVHEGGHRVPAIFSWPGKIPQGKITNETAMTMDLFPTLARLAGAELPARQHVDGIDLAPVMLGEARLPRRTLFWRNGDERAVRRGPWKLNLTDRHRPRLYNLERDLGEMTNLAMEWPNLVAELSAAWDAWEDDVTSGFIEADAVSFTTARP